MFLRHLARLISQVVYVVDGLCLGREVLFYEFILVALAAVRLALQVMLQLVLTLLTDHIRRSRQWLTTSELRVESAAVKLCILQNLLLLLYFEFFLMLVVHLALVEIQWLATPMQWLPLLPEDDSLWEAFRYRSAFLGGRGERLWLLGDVGRVWVVFFMWWSTYAPILEDHIAIRHIQSL